MPSGGAILSLGLGSFSSSTVPTSAAPATPYLPTIMSTVPMVSKPPKASDTVVAAPGIPALKRALVDLVLAEKYVDFGEFPPAKGLGKAPSALSGDLEDKIVLIQAADYLQTKSQIKDFATWSQCYAMYSAVLLTQHPDRAQSLFMYSAVIAR